MDSLVKQEYNVFALSGDKVEDSKIIELLGLTEGTEHTPALNYEILNNARDVQLERYPENAENINEMFDKSIYYLNVKLAARGMLDE